MALEINSTFKAFADFAAQSIDAGKSRAIARVAEGGGMLAGRKITAAKGDWVGIGAGRLSSLKDANNIARELFKNAIAEIFGGPDKIPDSVKDAMKFADYGKGKPLTARRILAVKNAVDQVMETERQATEKMNACIAEGKAGARKNFSHYYKQGDVDKLVETAFSSCGGNTVAMDIVKNKMRSFIVDGGGNLRSEEYGRKRAAGLADNLNMLKAMSAKNPAIYGFGESMLSTTGKPLSRDVLAVLVKAAGEAPIDGFRKLSASSSGMAIHKAVINMFKTIEGIMVSTGLDKKLEGSDERDPARAFIMNVMLSRCGRAALEKIRSALTGEAGANVLSYYANGAKFPKLFENESKAVWEGVRDVLNIGYITFTTMAGSVDLNLARLSSDSRPGELPETDFEPDIEWIGGDRLVADTISLAKEVNKGNIEKCIDNFVKESGKGADAFKSVLRRKLDGVHNPELSLQRRMGGTAKAMMDWSICGEMKKMAADGGETSRFKENIKSCTDAALVVGKTKTKLSNDFETARDQLARFVTGDGNATYADLARNEDRNKVHLLMAMISQETDKVAEDSVKYALDRREADKAFDFESGAGKATVKAFTITKTSSGGIDFVYNMEKPIKRLDGIGADADAYEVGEGSKFAGRLQYAFTGNEFNRLAGLDYGKFDDSEGREIFGGKIDTPAGRQYRENRFEKAVESFSREFKIDSLCRMEFEIALQPSIEEEIEQRAGPIMP